MTVNAWQQFWYADHRRIFAIALPMIVSNVAAPMLGLIDTAIIGHLPDAIYLSAVAVGAMAINFVYLLAIFLRMSTTGLIAQAYGAEAKSDQQEYWSHGLCFAVALGVGLIAALPLILWLLWTLVELEGRIQGLTARYIEIRIWGAPAALLNMVVLGVLLGRQQAKLAMMLVIVTNAINVIGNIILIIGFNLNVIGAAYSSLIAEWVTACIGFFIVNRSLHLSWRNWPRIRWKTLTSLAVLNQDIFIRSLLLQFCVAMMTAYATYYGSAAVAANAVLMQFLMLISLGLDGIAYAIEALIGQAKGQRNPQRMRMWFQTCMVWSCVFAIFYATLFWLAGEYFIQLITNIPEVIDTARVYLPWLILLPFIAHWSYFFDGVFIGLSASKAMRNTMALSTFGVFIPVWWLTQPLGNHGLWLAFVCFLGARGITQAIWIRRNHLLKGHT